MTDVSFVSHRGSTLQNRVVSLTSVARASGVILYGQCVSVGVAVLGIGDLLRAGMCFLIGRLCHVSGALNQFWLGPSLATATPTPMFVC